MTSPAYTVYPLILQLDGANTAPQMIAQFHVSPDREQPPTNTEIADALIAYARLLRNTPADRLVPGTAIVLDKA